MIILFIRQSVKNKFFEIPMNLSWIHLTKLILMHVIESHNVYIHIWNWLHKKLRIQSLLLLISHIETFTISFTVGMADLIKINLHGYFVCNFYSKREKFLHWTFETKFFLLEKGQLSKLIYNLIINKWHLLGPFS